MKRILNKKSLGAILLTVFAAPAIAVPPPVTGVSVPELAAFDVLMQDFMEDNGIDAGVLGIMRDNCVVYMRGFGWQNVGHTDRLGPDAMLRLASVTKPVIAAAIVRLDQQLGGTLLTRNAFDLGQADGGVLDLDPWPAVGDNRLQNITVQQLINHQGGWDDNSGAEPDWTYREVQIANAMGVASPPGRTNTMRYILGRPLDFNPGTTGLYANTNYLALGLILEQESGMSVETYVRTQLLGQFPWVNQADIARGRTFVANKHPREPHYHSFGNVTNVFDPNGASVAQPHGGWDHEARVGQGGLISAAVPLLTIANNHTIRGVPIDPTNTGSWTHTGSLPSGTATVLRRRGDGICFVVLFNRRSVSSGDPSFGGTIQGQIDTLINAGGIDWPAECVDGTWVDFEKGVLFGSDGTFLNPYLALWQGVNAVPIKGNVQFKPGSGNYTGIYDKPMFWRAPMGAVRIGE